MKPAHRRAIADDILRALGGVDFLATCRCSKVNLSRPEDEPGIVLRISEMGKRPLTEHRKLSQYYSPPGMHTPPSTWAYRDAGYMPVRYFPGLFRVTQFDPEGLTGTVRSGTLTIETFNRYSRFKEWSLLQSFQFLNPKNLLTTFREASRCSLTQREKEEKPQ